MIILTDSSRFIVPAWGIHGLEEPKIFEFPKTTWSFQSARLAPKDSATGRRDIEAPCRKGSRNSKLRPRCTQRVPVDMSFSFTSGSLQYAKAWKTQKHILKSYWNLKRKKNLQVLLGTYSSSCKTMASLTADTLSSVAGSQQLPHQAPINSLDWTLALESSKAVTYGPGNQMHGPFTISDFPVSCVDDSDVP